MDLTFLNTHLLELCSRVKVSTTSLALNSTYFYFAVLTLQIKISAKESLYHIRI